MTPKIIVGFDIGGTHIAAVAVSKKRIIKKAFTNTPKNKASLILVLKKLARKFGGKDSPQIGVAVAGIISGTVLKKAPNIPYLADFDFAKIFPKLYVIKVDNDARSFLRANLFNKPKKSSIAFTIGTGIGRAYSQKGKVKTIKQFEYPEKWEKDYQRIRDGKTTAELAKFLATKLSVIIRQYKPKQIFMGGGVIVGRGKKFILPLKKHLKENGVSGKITIAGKSRVVGAFGSALIFKE